MKEALLKIAYLNFVLLVLTTGFNACVSSNSSNSSKVVHWSYNSYIIKDNKPLEFQLVLKAPSTPGKYPLIFFFSGLDGVAPEIFYSNFTSYIVSESNSIIITFDKLRFIHLPDKEENLFEITLNWALKHMNDLFESISTPEIIKHKVFPDTGPNGYTLMSHSDAGHITCLYLYKSCSSIKKLILLDPVDGVDPFGIIDSYVTHPPKQLPFTIPTLIISTGLDSVPVSALSTACAPTNRSNTRFYDSLPGPTWYLNYTQYGHIDLLDDTIREYFAESLCKSCDKINQGCDYNTYRQNLVYAINYFINGVDEKNAQYINALTNPQASGLFNSTINIIPQYKSNGYNVLQTGPFCTHE